jgi:hypothetical protein
LENATFLHERVFLISREDKRVEQERLATRKDEIVG